MKTSELVACLTLANEIPFITILRCVEEQLWIQLTAISLNMASRCNPKAPTDFVSRSNLLDRPFRMLRDQRLEIACRAFKRG